MNKIADLRLMENQEKTTNPSLARVPDQVVSFVIEVLAEMRDGAIDDFAEHAEDKAACKSLLQVASQCQDALRNFGQGCNVWAGDAGEPLYGLVKVPAQVVAYIASLLKEMRQEAIDALGGCLEDRAACGAQLHLASQSNDAIAYFSDSAAIWVSGRASRLQDSDDWCPTPAKKCHECGGHMKGRVGAGFDGESVCCQCSYVEIVR